MGCCSKQRTTDVSEIFKKVKEQKEDDAIYKYKHNLIWRYQYIAYYQQYIIEHIKHNFCTFSKLLIIGTVKKIKNQKEINTTQEKKSASVLIHDEKEKKMNLSNKLNAVKHLLRSVY